MSRVADKLRDEAVVTERVRQRTMTSRRRRFVRRVVIFAVLTAGMVLVSMAHRDAQAMAQCRGRADFIADEFSANYLDRKLPILLPHRPEDRDWVLRHYEYRPVNDRFFRQERDVGVCCCQKPHRLTLRERGRHVVVFDGASFQVRWLTESEFKQQAAALHLPVPNDD